jgi:hypothetical protein
MLIVKIDLVHLKILETLFAAFAHVFRSSFGFENPIFINDSEFGANKDLGPELRILEE